MNGKTLLEHTIEFAKKVNSSDFIIVSTDSVKLKRFLKSLVFMPLVKTKNISSDYATSSSVAIHALKWFEKKYKISIDNVVLMQPTSPFRKIKTYSNCLNLLKNNPNYSVVTFKKIK